MHENVQPGEHKPWDDWPQPTALFLHTLADIAQALDAPLDDTQRWHQEGALPPPDWHTPPLWHAKTILPWIDSINQVTQKIAEILSATEPNSILYQDEYPGELPNAPSKDTPHDDTPGTPSEDAPRDIPNHTKRDIPNDVPQSIPMDIPDTHPGQNPENTPSSSHTNKKAKHTNSKKQSAFPHGIPLRTLGFLGIADLARLLGDDPTLLRQWFCDGCPYQPMPHPDLITSTGKPYWLEDGSIVDWLDTVTHARGTPTADPDTQNPPLPAQPSQARDPQEKFITPRQKLSETHKQRKKTRPHNPRNKSQKQEKHGREEVRPLSGHIEKTEKPCLQETTPGELLSPDDVALLIHCPLHLLQQWARRGTPCPPFDIVDTQASHHGYWYRDTIDPWIRGWLSHSALHNAHTISDAPSTPALPNKLRPEKSPGNPDHVHMLRTQKGKLVSIIYEQAKQDFTRLGDTAARTDLATLAHDYPRLIEHAGSLNQLPNWLVDAADRLALAGFWNAFDFATHFACSTSILTSHAVPDHSLSSHALLESRQKTPEPRRGTSQAMAFARGLHGFWLYRNGTLEDAEAHLAHAVRSPLLPQNARDLFALRKGVILQLSTGCTTALPDFMALSDREGSIGIQARYWIACTKRLRADCLDGLNLMPTPEELPAITGDYHIGTGWCYSTCALTDKAVQAQEKAVEYARLNGSSGAQGEALSYLAWAESWAHPEAAQVHAQDAIRLAQAQGNLLDEQRAHVAFAIAAAGTSPTEVVETAIEKAAALAYQTGNRRGNLRTVLARAWHAGVHNDNILLNQQIEEIVSLASILGSEQHWADIARSWHSGETHDTAALAARWQWLDGPEETMRRWRKILSDRQALMQS